MNIVQKAIQFLLVKAAGFPVWTGSTTDTPPGGWKSLDWANGYSDLHEVPAFVGCTRVLQSLIGSPPFQVFRESASGGARKLFADHWAYPLLYKSPNRYQTSAQLRKFLTLSYCTYGNAYASIEKLGNRGTSINPLLSPHMTPKFINDNLVYEYRQPLTGKIQTFAPEEIIHIKHASRDGIVGHPPVPKKLLERALATASYGAAFMRNQGRPSGVVESPKPMPKDPDFFDKWRADWKKLFAGENAGATAYLADGALYKIISSFPNDAQYIETLKQLDADFCGVFGVPLQLISSQDKAPTYASSEQFSLQFVQYTGAPLAEDIEQEFNKKLFPSEPNVYCKMDLDVLMRGDAKSQAEYFASMVQNGNMVNDEVRRKLNLPEFGGLSAKPHVQSNMIPVEDLGKLAAAAAATPGQAAGDIRKSAEVAEPGFAMHVSKMEQTVLPNAPLRKIISLRRDRDGRVKDAIVEESKIEA